MAVAASSPPASPGSYSCCMVQAASTQAWASWAPAGAARARATRVAAASRVVFKAGTVIGAAERPDAPTIVAPDTGRRCRRLGGATPCGYWRPRRGVPGQAPGHGPPRSGTFEVVDLHAGRGDGQEAGRCVERRLRGTDPRRLAQRIGRVRAGAGE